MTLERWMTTPIASRAEVSALVSVPGPKLSSWARKTGSKPPLVHTSHWPQSGRLTYPLVGIAEASTLNALRVAGLSMQQIRGTAEFIRSEHNDPYALASPKFVTDGTDAFVQDHLGLTRMRDLQLAIRETIRDHLRPLIIGKDGFVEAFKVDRFSSPVTVDPRFNAGQMSFVRNRVPLFAVAGQLLAGEHPQAVMLDYGLTPEEVTDVQANLRWLGVFL